jgi:hypothetical protein
MCIIKDASYGKNIPEKSLGWGIKCEKTGLIILDKFCRFHQKPACFENNEQHPV